MKGGSVHAAWIWALVAADDHCDGATALAWFQQRRVPLLRELKSLSFISEDVLPCLSSANSSYGLAEHVKHSSLKFVDLLVASIAFSHS